MSVDLSCPSCGKRLRIQDEFLGQKIKCPSCKNSFASSAAPHPEPAGMRAKTAAEVEMPPAAPPLVEESSPVPAAKEPKLAPPAELPTPYRVAPPVQRPGDAPRRVEEEAVESEPFNPAWENVSQGLRAVGNSIALVVFVPILVAGITLGISVVNQDPARLIPNALLFVLTGFVGLAAVAALAGWFSGRILCCAAPDARARRFAVASLMWFFLLPVVAFLANYLTRWALDWAEVQRAWGWIATPIVILTVEIFVFWQHVQFIRCVRAIGDFFDNRRLLTSTALYLALITVLQITAVAAFVVAVGWTDYPDRFLHHPINSGKAPYAILPALQPEGVDDELATKIGYIGSGVVLLAVLIFVVWFGAMLRRARGSIAKAQRLATEE